jgi:hypothetical protein
LNEAARVSFRDHGQRRAKHSERLWLDVQVAIP